MDNIKDIQTKLKNTKQYETVYDESTGVMYRILAPSKNGEMSITEARSRNSISI